MSLQPRPAFEPADCVFWGDPAVVVTATVEKAGTADLFSEDGRSALSLAASAGRLEAVRVLLDLGASIDRPNRDVLGYTPLIEAVRAGQRDVVHLLLARGAALQATDSRSGAPLLHACIAAAPDLVALLLDRGAQVDARDALGQGALHHLAENARPWGTAVVSDGVALETPRYELFCTIVELLLARGADPRRLHRGGFAPLHLAAAADDVRVISLLVAHGADVNQSNARGYTPLHAASDGGCAQAVLRLLQLGADVNLPDHSGFTPLIGATLAGSLETVECLLAHGADRTARTTEGYAQAAAGDGALDIARRLGLEAIGAALQA